MRFDFIRRKIAKTDRFNEQEVFDRICKGDESALQLIYIKFLPMINSFINKNNGTRQEALDVYQDAIIVFWQKAVSGKLVMTSKMSTYIYSICFNLWIKELQRKGRLTSEHLDTPTFIEDDKTEQERIVAECIQQLSEPQRRVLMLVYFDELSMREIAKRLGYKNSDTVKTQKWKAMQRLNEIIKEQYSEADFLN